MIIETIVYTLPMHKNKHELQDGSMIDLSAHAEWSGFISGVAISALSLEACEKANEPQESPNDTIQIIMDGLSDAVHDSSQEGDSRLFSIRFPAGEISLYAFPHRDEENRPWITILLCQEEEEE